MLPIRGLYQVAVRVKDLNRAKKNYREVWDSRESGYGTRRIPGSSCAQGGPCGMLVLEENESDWPTQSIRFFLSPKRNWKAPRFV